MPPSKRPVAAKPIKVYITKDEKQALLDRAGTLSLSEYLRRAGLGKRSLSPPAPEINRLAYLALAEIGESIQQLEIALGQSPQPDLDSTCLKVLQQHLNQIRWQLIAPALSQSPRWLPQAALDLTNMETLE